MRVGVFGAAGRMGAEVCRAVGADPTLTLAAAVDPRLADVDLADVTGTADEGVATGTDPTVMSSAGVEVAVDFTVAGAALANLRWCAANGVHAVVGTTGLGAGEREEMGRLFSGGTNCVMAPNFAIGAVLMMRFAEMAAPFIDGAEIIELHHDAKVDAPSGTSLNTAERMTASRSAAGAGSWPPDPTRHQVVAGARGAEGPNGIRIHAVRLRGLVAHQEVVMGATGQSLTIRHDSYDRTSFMPGVLFAVKAVSSRPGLTIGLEPLLGI
jgi:4-hydroxy-tetrahydrodipicolinate reductase